MRTTECTTLEAEANLLRRVGSILLDRIPDPMLICDPAGTVVLANAAFEDLVGRSRTDLVRKELSQTGLFERKRVKSWVAEIPRRTDRWTEQTRVSTWEGTRRERIELTPLRWGCDVGFALAVSLGIGKGPPPTLPYGLSDVCAAIARYASKLGHDMRNPLAGISTGIQFLKRTLKGEPQQAEALDILLSEVKNLDEVIHRLTSIDQTINVNPDAFNLVEVLTQTVEGHKRSLEQNHLRVMLSLDPFLPPVAGDPEQIARALSAVCERAVNVASERSPFRVLATLRALGCPDGPGPTAREWALAEFRCRTDRFHPKEMVETFDPSSPAWQEQAGLYVAAQIIEEHNGSIELSRCPGRQIRFSVTLPIHE
jgi:nitrogen-specific signal transduction histidine kinase